MFFSPKSIDIRPPVVGTVSFIVANACDKVLTVFSLSSSNDMSPRELAKVLKPVPYLPRPEKKPSRSFSPNSIPAIPPSVGMAFRRVAISEAACVPICKAARSIPESDPVNSASPVPRSFNFWIIESPPLPPVKKSVMADAISSPHIAKIAPDTSPILSIKLSGTASTPFKNG